MLFRSARMARLDDRGGRVGGGESGNGNERSPLEKAKAIAASQARSDKDAHWLGVSMEYFSLVNGAANRR